MSTGKIKPDKLLLSAVRLGSTSVGITFVLLIPAALCITHGKISGEQCSTAARLCLFLSCLITESFTNREKGIGKEIAAILSSVIILIFFGLFAASIPHIHAQISRTLLTFISALVGSLTGTIRFFNHLYNKKQNRNIKYTNSNRKIH